MSLDNNYLALFNATMLRNKREVLLSIEDYFAHHQEENNGESYCAEKRGVILNICQKFLEAVQKTEIPQLIKPFHCYTYSLTHAGMSLSRLVSQRYNVVNREYSVLNKNPQKVWFLATCTLGDK